MLRYSAFPKEETSALNGMQMASYKVATHQNIILPGLTCKRKIKESENLGAESGMWEIRRCGVTGINYNCAECIMGINYAALGKVKQGKMNTHFSMMHSRPWEVGGRLPLCETIALLRAFQ